MPTESDIADLVHTIQLAIAPVFLLSGIGTFLIVLTNRLARVIDRMRWLDESPQPAEVMSAEGIATEYAVLSLRGRRINRAITCCTLSAFLIAAMVAMLFMGAFVTINLAPVVGVAFVLAMLALIAGLTSFLLEIHAATRHFRKSWRQGNGQSTEDRA